MQDRRSPLEDIMKSAAHKTKGEKPAEEEESEILSLGDMNGRYATMRPAHKALTRMHLVDKAGRVRTFQYNFLDVESIFDGGTITLLFAGTKHWQVTAKGHGRDVWRIYDYITQHRWSYLREEPRPYTDDGDTVFTEITIVDVTPKERP